MTIERWRLDDSAGSDVWSGRKTVTFSRYDLKIIMDALSCAEYEGVISKEQEDEILDILDIEHSY